MPHHENYNDPAHLPKGSECPRCKGTGKCVQILLDPTPVNIPGMGRPVHMATGVGKDTCRTCNGKGTL